MATGAQFSRNIRRRGRQVVNSASEAVRRAAKAGLKSAVWATQVDTGEARSNWRVGAGAAPSAVIPPYFPYPKNSKANGQGKGETANASAAISAGVSRINSIKGVSGVGLKTSIIIANNTRQMSFISSAPIAQAALGSAASAIRGFKLLRDY